MSGDKKMNDMATVEYLLRQYAEYSAKTEEARKKDNDYEYAYYNGKAEMAHDIINERFGMTIRETDTEYIAENSVCSVKVTKQ